VNDEPMYTPGGIFACFLLVLGFYGFFFGIVGVAVLVGKLL
jgi:hypothetical protein